MNASARGLFRDGLCLVGLFIVDRTFSEIVKIGGVSRCSSIAKRLNVKTDVRYDFLCIVHTRYISLPQTEGEIFI